jgi:hypothetical protein
MPRSSGEAESLRSRNQALRRAESEPRSRRTGANGISRNPLRRAITRRSRCGRRAKALYRPRTRYPSGFTRRATVLKALCGSGVWWRTPEHTTTSNAPASSPGLRRSVSTNNTPSTPRRFAASTASSSDGLARSAPITIRSAVAQEEAQLPRSASELEHAGPGRNRLVEKPGELASPTALAQVDQRLTRWVSRERSSRVELAPPLSAGPRGAGGQESRRDSGSAPRSNEASFSPSTRRSSRPRSPGANQFASKLGSAARGRLRIRARPCLRRSSACRCSSEAWRRYSCLSRPSLVSSAARDRSRLPSASVSAKRRSLRARRRGSSQTQL